MPYIDMPNMPSLPNMHACNALRYITSHHITSHYITLHYVHCIALHCITVHYIAVPEAGETKASRFCFSQSIYGPFRA